MSNNSKAQAALAEIEQYFLNRQDVIDGDYGIPEPNEEMRMLQEVEIVKAALSAVPVLNIKCEAITKGIIGATNLKVIRVDAEDDGSFTAVTDYWPKNASPTK